MRSDHLAFLADSLVFVRRRAIRLGSSENLLVSNPNLTSVLRCSIMHLTFVETRVFTALWHKRLDDDDLRGLQLLLLERPTAGDPIPGCGLIRKLRFGGPSRGKGKRGGVRVLYVLTEESGQINLITVYGKEQKDDLSKDQLKAVCDLARTLRKELLAKAAERKRKDKARQLWPRRTTKR